MVFVLGGLGLMVSELGDFGAGMVMKVKVIGVTKPLYFRRAAFWFFCSHRLQA